MVSHVTRVIIWCHHQLVMVGDLDLCQYAIHAATALQLCGVHHLHCIVKLVELVMNFITVNLTGKCDY